MSGEEAAFLDRIVAALVPVPGLKAIVLGGSRGRGTHGPASDYDLGLYFDSATPLDTEALRVAVTPLAQEGSSVPIDIGEWGPWIVGGAWLRIGGRDVDLLYRDLDQVEAVIGEARAGRFSMNYQVGHPHGFCSTIWMGEIATCRLLHDPSNAAARAKALTDPYPETLAAALIARFGWEAGFALDNAELAARRRERVHFTGCVYRALACLAQALFALNRRYLINEKGAIEEAATMPITLTGLAEDAQAALAAAGAGQWQAALTRLAALNAGLRRLAPEIPS